MTQVLHATNLAGIEKLIKHEDCGNDYLCCSSIECNETILRDIIFLVEGEIIEEFYGDCGSDGSIGDAMSVNETAWDEVHVTNNYEVKGLYWKSEKDIELYAGAYEYITSVLELPCEIYNAEEDTQEKIKEFAEDIEEETEFLEWLEELGIEDLIV